MEIDIAKIMFRAQNIFGLFVIIILGLLLFYKKDIISTRK